jgi:cell division septum initiation protein DivIVA
VSAIDTYKVLDQLEALVEDSKKFMGFVKLDEDEFFMLVSKLRASLPEDVRRAGKIAQNSDKIMEAAQSEAEMQLDQARHDAERVLSEGHAEAERLVAEAKAQSEALVSQSEVQRIAAAQAREIVARAEQEADEIRAGADDYALGVLSSVDGRVNGMLTTIRRGRQKLEQNAASAASHTPRRVAPYSPSESGSGGAMVSTGDPVGAGRSGGNGLG